MTFNVGDFAKWTGYDWSVVIVREIFPNNYYLISYADFYNNMSHTEKTVHGHELNGGNVAPSSSDADTIARLEARVAELEADRAAIILVWRTVKTPNQSVNSYSRLYEVIETYLVDKTEEHLPFDYPVDDTGDDL